MQGDGRIRNIAFQNDKFFVQFELRDDVDLLNTSFSNEGNREVILVSIQELTTNNYTVDQLSKNLNVFPNPVMSGDDLFINLQGFENIDSEYFLINAEGFIIQRGACRKGSSNIKISTQGLYLGIYYLHLKSQDGFENFRVVVI